MADPRVVCGGYTLYIIDPSATCHCALYPWHVSCDFIIQEGHLDGREVKGQCVRCAKKQREEWRQRDEAMKHHELRCTVPAKSRVDLWEGFYEPAAGTAGGVGAQAQPALPVKKEGE